jgi:hypothetical protein
MEPYAESAQTPTSTISRPPRAVTRTGTRLSAARRKKPRRLWLPAEPPDWGSDIAMTTSRTHFDYWAAWLDRFEGRAQSTAVPRNVPLAPDSTKCIEAPIPADQAYAHNCSKCGKQYASSDLLNRHMGKYDPYWTAP